MTEGGWAAAGASGVVAFFGFMKWIIRTRERPQLSVVPHDSAWRNSVEERLRTGLSERERIASELMDARSRSEHNHNVQMVLLNKIDLALIKADLPRLAQRVDELDERLQAVERIRMQGD